MSFFDEFNHVTPYSIRVNVGKNRQFKNDPNIRSHLNHKGRTVAFYKKAKTIEELEKYGYGEYVVYLPTEEVSMPIDIKVTSDEQITPVFEETSKYTNKEFSNHRIRIYNTEKKQVGYASLSLNASGDITNKTCFYETPDGSETIMHTIYNKIDDERIIKDEHFSFKRNDDKETKEVEISQRDGRVVGASIIEKELETYEDVAFQSITDFSTNESTPKIKKYIASCVVDETDRQKRGGTLIPWECMTLEADLFEYQKKLDEFQRHAERFKKKTGMVVSIERAIEIGELSYDEQKRLGIPPFEWNPGYYSTLAAYLADENNNLLKDFKGNYIGNILRLTGKGYEGCVVTKHQKDGKDYRLYTMIDFKGTNITIGTGIDEIIGDEDRDPKYFKRLRSTDKNPTFVTTINENGDEQLVLYKGSTAPEECPEYQEFVENFIAPFEDIKPIQISKVLNKQTEKDR